MAAENTLQSFRLAFDYGADGVELDVRVTADNVLVVCHDEDDPWGQRIFENKYHQLRHRDEHGAILISTLMEVLKEISGRGIVDIEIKDPGISGLVVTVAHDYLHEGTYAFSSFRPEIIAECRKLAPQIPSYLIIEKKFDLEPMLAQLRSIDASGIAPHHSLISERAAEFFHLNKLPIFAWTVNNLKEARKLATLGVAGIITDKPREMVLGLRE
jgi:glycerophosphoryl diester phosphodiesterase